MPSGWLWIRKKLHGWKLPSFRKLLTMLYDLFHKIFSIFEQKPRKRKASISSGNDSPLKKHRCLCERGDCRCGSPRDDDVEIVEQENIHSAVKVARAADGFSARREATFPRKWNYRRRSIYSDASSTLTTTAQLREKQQYGRVLENFLPHRIHVLEHKTLEPSVSDNGAKMVSPNLEVELRSKVFSPITTHVRGVKMDPPRKPCPEVIDLVKQEATAKRDHKLALRETTNSLREKLSLKSVTKEDFILQRKQRYNEIRANLNKSVEEMESMAVLLSNRNRLTREAAWKEQVTQSMKLCAEILDEKEDAEEPSLPELTTSMMEEVKRALIPRPPNEVLVEAFGLRITRKDINTLADLNWLNDEVINFYMNLLITRSEKEGFPKVYAMNTFFYPKLLSNGHSSLKRWTRKVDIFSKDLLVVPVHLSMHWCMSIVDFRDKSIRYYNSMGSGNPRCLAALRQYLEDESMDKRKKPYDTSDWKLISEKDIPQQHNGSDCGVFSCTFAEHICANKKLNFSQDNMPYFRNKMVYEIINAKLL